MVEFKRRAKHNTPHPLLGPDGLLNAPLGTVFQKCGECNNSAWYAIGGAAEEHGLHTPTLALCCTRCGNLLTFTTNIEKADLPKSVDGNPVS